MDSKTFDKLKDMLISVLFLSGIHSALIMCDELWQEHKITDEQYLCLTDKVEELKYWR